MTEISLSIKMFSSNGITNWRVCRGLGRVLRGAGGRPGRIPESEQLPQRVMPDCLGAEFAAFRIPERHWRQRGWGLGRGVARVLSPDQIEHADALPVPAEPRNVGSAQEPVRSGRIAVAWTSGISTSTRTQNREPSMLTSSLQRGEDATCSRPIPPLLRMSVESIR